MMVIAYKTNHKQGVFMLKIQQTTNYSQFKFLAKNRPVYPNELVESIKQKNMLAEHPILCDKKMQVIDGQHRLRAAQMLNTPIYYIVSENLTENDIGICQVQKAWLVEDFLKFYLDQEDYSFVYKIRQTYKFPLHFTICSLGGPGREQETVKSFRKGTYTIKESKEKLENSFKNLKEIFDLVINIAKAAGKKNVFLTTKIYRSFWQFINKEGYDQNRMIQAMNAHPLNLLPILNFNSQPVINDAIRDRLYNFKLRSHNHIS
jgi:hypothetical protein